MIKHINGTHASLPDAIKEVSKVPANGVVNVVIFKTNKGFGSSVTIGESNGVPSKAKKAATKPAAKSNPKNSK